MIRTLLIIAAVAVWLLCFGVALVTVIPLSVIGLAATFDASFTIVERMQGFGFAILGAVVVTVLFVALTRISRLFAPRSHAAD